MNILRHLLSRLEPLDYEEYVARALDKNCSQKLPSCEEDRLIVLDIVARMGDVNSQRLLVTHVLSRDTPVDEELRRVFIHCAALEQPTEVIGVVC